MTAEGSTRHRVTLTYDQIRLALIIALAAPEDDLEAVVQSCHLDSTLPRSLVNRLSDALRRIDALDGAPAADEIEGQQELSLSQ